MDRELKIIGVIHSSITDLETAPKMEHESGAVKARIEIDPAFREGLDSLKVGARIELFTWFHKAQRDVLSVHPRGDMSRPQRGVFTTRSPFRPNPIGLHRVTVVSINGLNIEVEPLEAINGTPVIDIKPVP